MSKKFIRFHRLPSRFEFYEEICGKLIFMCWAWELEDAYIKLKEATGKDAKEHIKDHPNFYTYVSTSYWEGFVAALRGKKIKKKDKWWL